MHFVFIVVDVLCLDLIVVSYLNIAVDARIHVVISSSNDHLSWKVINMVITMPIEML